MTSTVQPASHLARRAADLIVGDKVERKSYLRVILVRRGRRPGRHDRRRPWPRRDGHRGPRRAVDLITTWWVGQPTTIAVRAREIFAAWANDGGPEFAGWATMSVADLGSVCDPNAAFDSAATDCGADDGDWDMFVELLDESQAFYDHTFAR